MDELFLDEGTSLADIADAGWYIEHSSGGGWWFRHRETQKRSPVPYWIIQAVEDGTRAGMESVQHQLQSIVKGKAHYLGRCPPSLPDRKKKAEST